MTTEKKSYKRKNTELSANGDGLMPPNHVDLEELILGAVLLEPSAFHQISDMFFPDLFYKPSHHTICEAILSLKNKGTVVDIATVCVELKSQGKLDEVGGAYYVSKLTTRVASAANLETHTRIVMEAFIKRHAILASINLIKEAYDQTSDAFDIIDSYEKNLTEITSKLFVTRATDTGSLHNQLLEHDAAIKSADRGVIGVPSGFVDLDAITGGWQKSDLIILAARPGMGKTALAIQLAKNAAIIHKKPAAIFSLEMSSLQLYMRLCSQETEIPLEKFMRTGLDEGDMRLFNRDVQSLKGSPLYIDDTGALTIFDLRNRARKLKREKGIELIIIDYLQLMASKKPGNREQEISEISRGLKSLAKELDIPIIALSQLSRESETGPGDKIPKLRHLRDSGSIEQDADMVIFIYRPEYYGITYDADNNSTKGVAKIIIAKNRHGALDDIDLKWKAECVKFLNFHEPVILPEDYNQSPLENNFNFLQ